jgi:outer membrane biosynthesis protein TonB
MVRRTLLVVFVAFALTACGKQRVATQPDLPALAPPPPPPRVVTPPDADEQPPAQTPEPERKAPRRVPPKTDATRDNAPKPEPPKPQPAKPDTSTPPAPETQQKTTLQTKPPATQQEMDRQARGLLAQASRDLGRIHYASLNVDGKGQYDTAKRFVEQAQQALTEQNFVLALSLADKAATIAAVLVGR